MAEELSVAKGKLRGPWLKFFADGSPKLDAEHAAHEEPIIHNAWDEARKQVVKNGTGVFRDDGRSIKWEYDVFFQHLWQHETELKKRLRHGKLTTYSNGVLWSVAHYKNGVQEGDATDYWDNGRVRSVTPYRRGKAGKETSFPKFDHPVPAVLIAIEADERLYTAWGHIPVDEYPHVLNLEEVHKRVVMPAFLREVHERNLANAIKDEYEDWNTFDDGIAYFLTVDENGAVTSAAANGSGVCSASDWDTYIPLLKQLRFTPGRIGGRAAECRVLANVDHTFVEG